MYTFAIIGCGSIASLHAEVIGRHGKLVAVSDEVRSRADDFAKRFGASVYYSPQDIFNLDVDIICICTPNGRHAEHTIRALQGGKHVLCEAPLCLTTAGAWQIIETEKFCRRKVFVVNTASSQPQIALLSSAIKEHTNGHAYEFSITCSSKPEQGYAAWKGKIFPGGGSLYTDFSNYIDLLVHLFGPVDEASGASANTRHRDTLEMEDEGEARIRMKSGINGTLQWSLSNTDEGSITITRLKKPVQLKNLHLLLAPSLELYHGVYDRFIAHLEQDGAPSSLFDAARTVEAIEKIYKSVSLNPA